MRSYDYAQVYGRATPGLPGTLKVLPDVYSPQLRNRRDLLVWLPPGYRPGSRYPVLYVQDGQNLFDPATSFAWHWRFAETMAFLASRGRPAIVVGVPNKGAWRIAEYSPFVDRRFGGGLGDHYVHFLSDTVKPTIDGLFATRPEPAATGLVGASLGGILALYGFARRPDVFGLCAALSPSCWFAGQALNRHLTSVRKAAGRVYLDVGLRERGGRRRVQQSGGSKRYSNAVDRVYRKLLRKGLREDSDLLYVIDPEGEHNEWHWRRRLPLAMSFLLAGTR
jgi:predicted alpha/beta superfamily hydrolase